VPGIRGAALELNGTTDFVDLGASPALNVHANGTFTMACWVKSSARFGHVFLFRGSPDGLPILGVQIHEGKLVGWVRRDGGVFHPHMTKGELKGPGPLRSEEWHHVALARDAAGVMEMYQDGQFLGRTLGQETAGKITTNGRALGADLHVLRKRGSDVNYLQGCVDEFCVFSRVLTAQEVAKLAGREP
jgi:hypothetical protein